MDYTRPIEAVIPGVQGRVLGVLARTDRELTMRGVAELAGVSVQQTSVVLAHLVTLGIVGRRDAGTAALVRLERDNEAARTVLGLSGLTDAVIDRLRVTAGTIEPAPASLMVFGSFARREARADSDFDVLAIRPTGISGEGDRWTRSLGDWLDSATRIVGNPVNHLELAFHDLEHPRVRRGPVWKDIAREGTVLAGSRLTYNRGRLTLVGSPAAAQEAR